MMPSVCSLVGGAVIVLMLSILSYQEYYTISIVMVVLLTVSTAVIIHRGADTEPQFVETAAYQAARDQLEQGNILTLTGRPGEGKTTIGRRLCYDFRKQGYKTVFYSKGNKINWAVLKVAIPTLVVFDVVANEDLLFMLTLKTDSVKVLIIRAHNHRTYDEFPTLNVTEVNRQNMARTKRDYLKMLHMSRLGISTYNHNYIISNLPIYVGFPKALKLFRNYKHYTDPVTYFTYPLLFFIGEMQNMSSQMEEWIYLLLSGGHCEKCISDDLMKSMHQLFPKLRKTTHIQQKLKLLIGSYLDVEQHELYFSHPAIYDACLYVVDRKYPGFLWKHCQVVFEREEKQSHINLPKQTVFISQHNTDMFLTQIVEDLDQGMFKHTLSHPVLRIQENIDRLFAQLGDRLKDIVIAEEDSVSFFNWVVQSHNQKLLTTMLDNTDLTQADVNKVLKDCVKANQFQTFRFLRNVLVNLEHQTIHYPIESDSDMNSLITIAVNRTNVKLVQLIADYMPNLMMTNIDGNTALHVACLRGNAKIVKCLLKKMKDSKDRPGQALRTPVMMAALKGHGQLYEYLVDIEKCQLTGVDENYNTILHLACVGGNLQIVRSLVSSKTIDTNQKNQRGETPLMIAASCNHKEIFEWMVENDMDSFGGVTHSTYRFDVLPRLEPEDKSRLCLLHTAASTGDLKLAKLFLSNIKVDINITDGSGRNAIMLAAAGGHGQMFDFLLDRGSALTLKDKASNGILHMACQGRNRAVVNKVIEHHFIDVNSRNDNMKTPLSYAVETGDKQIFNTFLNKDGDLSVVDRDANTLLHLACKGGSLAIVEHLLSLKTFDIDARNIDCRTPLLVAAYSGHTDICFELISQLSDVSLPDQDGNDALLVAADTGNLKLTEYILTRCNYSITKRDKSALTKAAAKGHSDVFKFLTDSGRFDLLDMHNQYLLHFASVGGNVDIVTCIISETTVDINMKNEKGKTPAMLAAENGHQEILDILDSKGCNLSTVDKQGETILHAAVRGGNGAIVKSILSTNKVRINTISKIGRTAVMQAILNGNKQVFDLLLRENCDLSVVDHNKNTVLSAASYVDNTDLAKYILSLNSEDINVRGHLGRTPAMQAAGNGCRGVFDLLVSEGADLSMADDNKNTILNIACLKDNVEFVKYLLTLGIDDINVRGFSGRTPLMTAASKGCRRVFDLLVKEGADHSVLDDNKDTILNVACLSDNTDFLKYILTWKSTDINVKGYSGRTPIMKAAFKGCRQMFDLLVSKKAILSVVDDDKNTILHVACLRDNVEFVKYLLGQLDVADINVRGYSGRTALMQAATKGCRGVFELLLSKGADLSVLDDNKDTVLHAACLRDNVDFVKYLLTLEKIDINVKGHRGRTPVMEAASSSCRGVFDMLVHEGADLSMLDINKNNILHVVCLRDNVEFVRYLLTLQITDINARGYRGRTPAMQAAISGCKGVFDLLMHEGADLSVMDDIQNTILNVACYSDNVEFVKYLLTLNIADINVRGKLGRTPLMQAANKGCRRVFEFLVGKGANLLVVDLNGWNILHLACVGGDENIVKYILNQGIVDIRKSTKDDETPLQLAERLDKSNIIHLLTNNRN